MVAVEALLEALACGTVFGAAVSPELREYAYRAARHLPSPELFRARFGVPKDHPTPDINAYRRMLGTMPKATQQEEPRA